MNEQLTLRGEWWLPASPETRLGGDLEYLPGDDIRLQIVGSFSAREGHHRLDQHEVILGQVHGGRVTLLNCVASNQTESRPGPITTEYRAAVFFQGEHFKSPADILFESASLRFSNLDEWVNTPTIRHESEDGGKETISWERRPLETLLEDGGLKLGVGLSHGLRMSRLTDVTVSQRACLTFEYGSPQGLSRLWSDLRAVQYFLAVAQNFAVLPIDIKLHLPASEPTAYGREVNVYRLYADHTKESIRSHDMLFTLPAVRKEISSLIEAWFRRVDDLNPILGLFFMGSSDSVPYSESTFLTTIQAVEAYHRRMRGGAELPADQHEARIKAIKLACPQAHQKWLVDRLRFSNEPSLRKRLRDLLESFSFLCDEMRVDREEFISTVVNTRNYLTHFSAELKAQAADGRELMFLPDKLRILLSCCLLEAMGMPADRIKKLITDNRNMTMILRYN